MQNSEYIKSISIYINNTVIPLLIKDLATKTQQLMRKQLAENASISTETLQKYVTATIDKNSAIIYVDFETMSNIESAPPEYGSFKYSGGKKRGSVVGSGLVEWGRFTNTFRKGQDTIGGTKWNGELITFRLAEWLEKGGAGGIGNQPIAKNEWYTKTANQVEQNLDIWVMQFMKKYGFDIIPK